MTLRELAHVVARRKWLIACSVLCGVATAVALTVLQTPIYEAASEVLVQPRGQDGIFGRQVLNLSTRAIDTEIQVIEGEAVRRRVQTELELSASPPPVNASAVGETDVISVAVRDSNAANAVTLADAYAEAYIDIRREQGVNELLAASEEVQTAIRNLQAQIDDLDEDDPRRAGLISQLATFQTTLDELRVDAALRTGGATLIKSAELPASPIEPTPARAAALAGVVGLMIGLAAAFLVDYWDDKVRSEQQLERIAQRPVLAVVPVDPPPDARPIAVSEPSHVAVEEYRGLRTNLQFLGLDRPLKVLQVTSSIAGEGKTTTATNLSVVLAQAGHRVAIVDADLRKPRVHATFGVAQTPGFIDLLLGMNSRDVVKKVDVGEGNRVSVYTSGTVPSNPSEMLSGQRVRHLFHEMGAHYDYVVVDSAPILPVSDSVALATAVDGVLVVAQAGRVSENEVVETLDRLDRVAAPVLGLVLNQASEQAKSYYAYGGYNGPAGAKPLPVDRAAPTVDA